MSDKQTLSEWAAKIPMCDFCGVGHDDRSSSITFNHTPRECCMCGGFHRIVDPCPPWIERQIYSLN